MSGLELVDACFTALVGLTFFAGLVCIGIGIIILFFSSGG